MTHTPPAGPIRRPAFPRMPLVAAAAMLMLGIVAGRYLPLEVPWWGMLCGAALLTAAATLRRPDLRVISCGAVGGAILSLGAAYSHVEYYSRAEDDILTYTGNTAILASLRGQVVTSPIVVQDEPNPWAGYHRPDHMEFVLQAEEILLSSEGSPPMWRRISGSTRVQVEEPAGLLAAGQRVELTCTLGRVHASSNPGQGNPVQFARQSRIMTWVSVPTASGVTVLSDPPRGLERAFWNVRAAARQHLSAMGRSEDGMLLNALITGERHRALQSLNRSMVRLGVAHMLSISGQHLALFLLFVYGLCRVASVHPTRAAVLVLALLAAYMLLAEPNPPLLRSAIMAALLCLAAIIGRPYSALNALAAAAVLLLAMDPLELFSAGFQLSFGIVTGMVLLHRPVRDLLFGRWLRRRGLIVFRRDQWLRRWLYYSAADWAILAVVSSLNAYLVSVPLAMTHFGLFSPYAAILSLLLSPLLVAVLAPGYLSVALAWPLPNLSAMLGELAAYAAKLLADAVDVLQRLPWVSIPTRPVGPGWVVLFYAAVGVIVLHRRIPAGRWLAGAAMTALIAATFWTQRPAPPPPTATLDVLDVGAGQCAVLRTPSGSTFILDAGTRSGMEVYRCVLGPFLQSQRMPWPEAAFISHPNTDHYSAIPFLLEQQPLRRVYLNDAFMSLASPGPSTNTSTRRVGAASVGDEVATALLNVLDEHGTAINRLHKGDSISLDEHARVDVLWPPEPLGGGLNANDSSLVLRITCDGTRLLVTGDLEAPGQKALLESGQDLRAAVVIMPHHGIWRKTLPDLLAAVDPQIAIVSSSGDVRLPQEESSEAARFYSRLETGRRFLSTARNGWIRINLCRRKVEWQASRGL